MEGHDSGENCFTSWTELFSHLIHFLQRTIDRLQEPAIAPDNLSPTAIPTLHLDFARMLVRLRDWEAATAQLDMISAVESLKDQVAALRAQIEAKDEGVDEVNGGPRTVAVDEEGTTIALDANAAKKFAEAGQAAQCGEHIVSSLLLFRN